MTAAILSLDLSQIRPYVRVASRFRSEPTWRLGPRTIPDHELVYFLEGTGEYCIGGARHRYAPGDLVYTPPAVEHAYEGDEGVRCTHAFSHFDFSEASRGAGPVEVRGFPPLPVHVSLPAGSPLHALFLRLAVLDVSGPMPLVAIAQMRASGLLLEILSHWLEGPAAQAVHRTRADGLSARDRERVARSLEYLEQKFAEPLSVEDIAEDVALGGAHFARLFRQVTGLSPIAYLTRLRVGRAKALLANPTLNVSQVARQVGYRDVRYFARVFRKIDGIPPSTYREMVIGMGSEVATPKGRQASRAPRRDSAGRR